jgi:voltage-gated potassium channel
VAKLSKEEMANQPEIEVAKEVVIVLLVLIIAVAALSIWAMYNISHNLDGSVYYSLAALGDVNEEGYAAVILSAVVPYSFQFYEIVGILILDGIVKVVFIGLVVALLVKTLAEVDIGQVLHGFKSRRLENHTIVCGFSVLGERVCEQLSAQKRKFLVVEKSQAKLEELYGRKYPSVEGDFTDIKTLTSANSEKAKSIVFCADSDFVNLMGVIAARRLNKDISIIARARDEQSVVKMQRAGADLCIIPELVAGLDLGRKLAGV